MLPDVGEVGDVLWGSGAQFPLVTRAISSRDAPYVGCKGPSVVAGLITVGVLVGKAGPPALLAASCWWVGWVLVKLAVWPGEGAGAGG